MHVYHFTSTARLPWILLADELRPGANAVGNYPDPEFVWATTNDRGSRSAAASQGYREGMCLLVRFTLSVEEFQPWSKIPSLYPTWIPEAVERLERKGRKMGDDPAQWWCRVEPLPLSRAVSIETKAYREPIWVPLRSRKVQGRGDTRAIVVGNTLYHSTQIKFPDGRVGYQVGVCPAREGKDYEIVALDLGA